MGSYSAFIPAEAKKESEAFGKEVKRPVPRRENSAGREGAKSGFGTPGDFRCGACGEDDLGMISQRNQ